MMQLVGAFGRHGCMFSVLALLLAVAHEGLAAGNKLAQTKPDDDACPMKSSEQFIQSRSRAEHAKQGYSPGDEDYNQAINGSMEPNKTIAQPCNPIPLWSKDFDAGTYVIYKPGLYVVQEDIIFEPVTPGHLPPPNCDKYSKANGYWLGFFAAIAVAADDVIIDLNGFTIRMSARFAFYQRFWTNIQLGSKPFLANQGPPQFKTSSMDPIIANRVEIKNGVLGLSTHMGIHGNENFGLYIHDLVIRDFETGGIQLNGASMVKIERVTIGPSMGAAGSSHRVPALATLSQSIFLANIASEYNLHNKETAALKEAIEEFWYTSTLAGEGIGGIPPTNSSYFFTDPSFYGGLADGSAIYGILLHKSGIAIHEFGACTLSENETMRSDMVGFDIRDVVIKDLYLKSDEVVKLKYGPGRSKKTVLGPAGDIVQLFRLQDKDGYYKGTALSDAQRMMMIQKIKAMATGMAPEELFARYGSTNIPNSLLAWMQGIGTLANATSHLPGVVYECGGDSMGHKAKGVVALRVEFVKNVTLRNISVSGLYNYGLRSPYKRECANQRRQYLGGDVYVLAATTTDTSLERGGPFMRNEITYDPSSLFSSDGTVHIQREPDPVKFGQPPQLNDDWVPAGNRWRKLPEDAPAVRNRLSIRDSKGEDKNFVSNGS